MRIDYEHFGFVERIEDDYKIMILCNLFYENEIDNHSKLYWGRASSDGGARYDYPLSLNYSESILPIIPFVSKEETNKRLNNLITFA